MVQGKGKSVEEITKANLAKTLSKMKRVVAEREEIWLELFQSFVGMMVDADTTFGEINGKIFNASMAADLGLDAYEKRWGECGEMKRGAKG